MPEKWKSAIENNGYYSGNIYELFDDISFFDDCISNINSVLGNEKFHGYRSHIEGHPELNWQIPCTEIENRKNIIEKDNLKIFQQWHEINGWPGNQPHELLHFAIKKFVKIVYPKFEEDNLMFRDGWTLYENNDFIQFHTDGENIDRLCVFLIYLSLPETYNDGGGHLIIQDKKNQVHLVKPLRGNFVVLDFLNANLSHAVEVVKNDFKRYSFISFVYDDAETGRRKKIAKLIAEHKKYQNNKLNQ